LGGACLVVRCAAGGFPLAAGVAAARGGDGAGGGRSDAGQFQALAALRPASTAPEPVNGLRVRDHVQRMGEALVSK
jgi:hypothetical protein